MSTSTVPLTHSVPCSVCGEPAKTAIVEENETGKIVKVTAGCCEKHRASATCEHLWIRRRDGSWCAHCQQPRFGQDLNEEERERLQTIRKEKHD